MDIYQMIEDLGVRLEYSNHLPPHRIGAYLDDERRIVIRCNLTHTLEAEALHHEYIHAKYRDRSCHPTIEHRARREAAQLMIDPELYAAAERVNPSPHALARELDVELRVIEAYQRALLSGEIKVLAVA